MLFSNLNFIFLQLGTGCVSNCKGCSRKLEKYSLLNEEIIKNNINKLSSIFNNNLLIYNIDYFDLPKSLVTFILSKKNKFKNIYFHTNFRNIGKNRILGDIKFLYQRDLNKEEISFLIKFLLNNDISNNIDFIFWYDEEKYKIMFVKLLEKYFNIKKKKENYYIIGNNTIKIFNKDGERRKLRNCFFYNSIEINDGKIIFGDNFYISCLEVLINGDIRAHEPPCGYGNLIISNIYRTKLQILEDFKKFSLYINKFLYINKNINQSMICSKCNKNKYSYKIMDNKLNTN